MKVSVKFSFTEMVTPPRCRKARPIEEKDKLSVCIREIDESRAPLAFIVNSFDKESCMVRLYKGKLYRQFQFRRKDYDESKSHDRNYPLFVNQKANEIDWQGHLSIFSHYSYCWDVNVDNIKEEAAKYLIISGDVYIRTGEPYYSVTCFGLGNNHGGTGFFVRWDDFKNKKRIWGLSAENNDAAIERAVQIALERGDTESVDYIRSGGNGNIKVLIPEAIKRKYVLI